MALELTGGVHSPDRERYETSAISNLDASSHQPDKAIPLQHVQSHGHAFTMNTQHKRKELVGERHLVTSETVLRHQQPAG